MTYFNELVGTDKSIRQLARELDLSYETVRDRLNRDTPPEKRRYQVPMSKVVKAYQMMTEGLTLMQTSRLLDMPKSTLHDQVTKYKKLLAEEANEENY